MELKLTSSFHPMNLSRWFFCVYPPQVEPFNMTVFLEIFTIEIFNLNEMQTQNELLSSFEEFKVKGQMKSLRAWEYDDLSETRKLAKIYIKIKNVTGKMTEVTFWGPKGFTKKREKKHFYRNQMLQKRNNKPRVDTKSCNWNWKTDLKNRQARKRRSCCLFQLMFL